MRKDAKFFGKIIIIIALLSVMLLPYVFSIAIENVIEENTIDNTINEDEKIQEEVSSNTLSENIVKVDNTISDEVVDNSNSVVPESVKEDNEDKEKEDEVVRQNSSTVLEDLENDTNTNIITALTRYEYTTDIILFSVLEGEVDAKISQAVITKTTTGVAPFDTASSTNSSNSSGTVTWTAGDDVSEDDNIVRSFDQITYTLENTFVLKDDATVENYTGGVIEITASVPSSLAKLVEWDLSSMLWAENATISSDGTKFTAQYSMSENEITIPGKQTLVLVLKVLGAPNKTEITPTFTLNLKGNDETDKISLNADTVYVSAAPKYNIKLVRNTSLGEKKLTVDLGDDGTEETTGRMYGYGIILQLYNTDRSKGLKGIEYPTGDITFDINLKLERTKENSSVTEDITDRCTPILWNYKIQDTSNYGNISNRIMYWGSGYQCFIPNAPYGKISSYREVSVYNSGNIKMSQNESTISTTISGYDFDGIFPIYNYYHGFSTPHTSIDYTENIGCFSVGYFQVFVPFNEETLLENRSYYLTVSDNNFSSTSTSGAKTTTQMVTSDDSSKVQHVIYKSGSYSHVHELYKDNSAYLGSTYATGDAFAVRGQYIQLLCKFSMSISNDDDVYTANKFIKFDGDCVEPVLFTNGNKYIYGYFEGSMKFNVWYVTKKDGTNWKSSNEMNNANIEDMLIFENIEDIPEGYICIGEYFESDSNYGNLAVSSGSNNSIKIRFKVKDTATVGQTYGFTSRTQYWIDALDRNIYTITNLENFTYPTITWDSGNKQYIKTEYDENGEIISGTHYNGNQWGQTVLIVGGDLSITKTPIDESGAEKINYDYSKNEYNVTYKITPTLTTTSNSITDATIKITDTLPAKMTYVSGSSDYDEPEITENSDGTTTLVWYLYNVSSDKALQTITYQAHLDEMLENGSQLETTTIISEVPNTDEAGNSTYLIGNTEVSNRTYKTAVNIINLSSYSLFKTTETPVIEVNGIIHYKITAINKTDDKITDFQLLDILPYNGDGRGTNYNGTYAVEKIEITQTDTASGNTINSDNLKLYITSDDSVRSGVTAKDKDLGTTSIWSNGTSGKTINSALTAYSVIGEVSARERVEIDIYLKTDGNEPYDLYKNSATAQTNKETEVMETSIITVQDVKRILNGYVWFDFNMDGIISEGEKYLEGVKVTLLNFNGDAAYNINGEKIEAVYTDSTGYYEFEDMLKGEYIVQIDWSKTEALQNTEYSEIVLTPKEIGANLEINSKFNSNGATDVITTLNSVESPVLTENYVNAGLYGTVNFEFVKVAAENSDVGIGGTKFNLYKLICQDTSHNHDSELVDIENPSSCWTLVEETTSSIGNLVTGAGEGQVEFSNLIVNEEYRLVETKASLNRLLPEGQWKITYIKSNISDKGKYSLTAVGENKPPAFMELTDNQGNVTELLLPNMQKYDLPFSGNIGTKIFKTSGLAIIIVGIYLLFVRRRVTVNGYSRKSSSARSNKRARECTTRARKNTARADSIRKSAESKNYNSREENILNEEIKNTSVDEDIFSNLKMNKYKLNNMQNRILRETKYQDDMLKKYKNKGNKK